VKPADIAKRFWLLIPLMLIPGAALCAGIGGGSGFSYGNETAKNTACLACHGDGRKVKGKAYINEVQFGHTSHARIGCPTCHSGVSTTHPDGVKSQRADCRECHTDINDEYARSIHAQKTHCAGCHNPHKVQSPIEISGEEINKMCSGCHDGFQMTAKHGEWLPQSDLHLRMLPCITCHTGSKSYFISMYIVKGKNGSRFGKQELAPYDELKKLSNGKDIVSLIDTNGDHYVSLQELRMFNRDPSHKYLRLQGMMTPETASHNFEILDSRRNCTFCHASGSGPMQTSFLSLPEQNGTYTRVPVERGAVLDALYGTPDFYMMGSTKNGALNYVGLAIICGGLIMPVGHGFMRFMTRKNRQGKEH
jgi:predicted CXXCH cytochrome family protein